MRTGLVLGAGGYAGHAFHAGVLSALARLYSAAPFTCGEKVYDGMTGLAGGTTTGC